MKKIIISVIICILQTYSSFSQPNNIIDTLICKNVIFYSTTKRYSEEEKKIAKDKFVHVINSYDLDYTYIMYNSFFYKFPELSSLNVKENIKVLLDKKEIDAFIEKNNLSQLVFDSIIAKKRILKMIIVPDNKTNQ